MPRHDLVLGIDTGGTYTDGVLLDYRSRQVLASAKVLTTPEDLCLGVTEVIAQLAVHDPSRVRLVGISSTLATNAIAEGKVRDVALLLIGYDRDLIARYELDASFEARAVGYFRGGHTSGGEEQHPLDLPAIRRWVSEHRADIDALAISSYWSPLDPSHEEQAATAVRELTALPIVLGHQLSTRLDSVKRAATACLNAALVAEMQEFLRAVRAALARFHLRAPLMVVKGDGSLMPYAEAVLRPVETVLSGPAASAIGGRFLTGCDRALVVDVGGTTTDIALIEEAGTALSEDGIRVGDIETAVRAARVRTACIGCDSRIAVKADGEITLGPDRAIPLSRLAHGHARVERELRALRPDRPRSLAPGDLEYWVLRREPPAGAMPPRRSLGRRVVERLRRGPSSLSSLLQELDVLVPVQLDVEDLLARRVIERATVTPTDLLHTAGDLELWSRGAACKAVACTAALYGVEPDRFVAETLELVVARILEEVIVFLASAEGDDELPRRLAEGRWGRWLLDRIMRDDDPFLAVAITGRSLPLVGVGAPADILARRIANKLRTPFVLPEWSPVANAVGAVAGSVVVSREAIVYRRESGRGTSYTVQVDGTRRSFNKEDDSLSYAEGAARALARDGALAAGAVAPVLSLNVIDDGSIQRVNARAIGSPRLAKQGAPPRDRLGEPQVPLEID